MNKILITGLMLMATVAKAQDFHVIDLSELAVDYRNFAMVNPNGHDIMTYPDPPKEYLGLEMKLNVLSAGYLDPTVESWTTDSQYRGIGLQVRAGVRITDYVEFGYIHHSQHELDRNQQLPMGHFPEEDAVQLKIYLFRASPSGRGSLF